MKGERPVAKKKKAETEGYSSLRIPLSTHEGIKLLSLVLGKEQKEVIAELVAEKLAKLRSSIGERVSSIIGGPDKG
jgi:hypothetical protein